MTKSEEEAKQKLYGIAGCVCLILVIFIFIFVIKYSMIVLPVAGCVIITICAILMVKKRVLNLKARKLIIIGILIQISGLIFCFIWIYVAILSEIVDIWILNHTGQTRLDYFLGALISINIGTAVVNLAVLIISSSYIKPTKITKKINWIAKITKKINWIAKITKKINWKAKKVEAKKLEYNTMITQMRLQAEKEGQKNILFEREKQEEKNIGKHDWEAKYPKQSYASYIYHKPKPIIKPKPYKLTCPNCGEEILYYDHCDLCGWSKKVSKEFEKPEEEKKSRRIPQRVKNEVWRRDGGRCVECGSRFKLEYDHIIPFSKGGSNTARNIELLCERCNRKKYNKI